MNGSLLQATQAPSNGAAIAQRHDKCCSYRDRGLRHQCLCVGLRKPLEGSETTALYWVNGTPETLPSPSGTTNAEATAITVSGSNVYVSGWVTANGSTESAVYWVNGTLESLPLPSGTTSAVATGIAVATYSGTIVYVSGYAYSNTMLKTATYWASGIPQFMFSPELCAN